jgi:hypothetical protein
MKKEVYQVGIQPGEHAKVVSEFEKRGTSGKLG